MNNDAYLKLCILCYSKSYTDEEAFNLLSYIDDINKVFVYSSEFNLKTVLLECASDANRYNLVKKLLEMGANPNLIYDNETPFTKLFYECEDDEFGDCNYLNDSNERSKIIELMLAYGADPNVIVNKSK